MEFFYSILTQINELPNHLWDFFFGSYDESKDHDPLTGEFWWRELFHFLGGAIVGVTLTPLFHLFLSSKVLICIIVTLGVLVGIGLKEFLGDASEQPFGWDFKNIVDTLFWTLGAFALSAVFI